MIAIMLLIIIVCSSAMENNSVLAATQHVHQVDCYVGHNHKASGCTLIPAHHHTGNAQAGGGCYKVPIYHNHTNCKSYGKGGKHSVYNIHISKETDSYMSDSGMWHGKSAHVTLNCSNYSKSYGIFSLGFGIYSGDYSDSFVHSYGSGGNYLENIKSRQYTMGKENMSFGDPELYSKCKAFYNSVIGAVYDVTSDTTYVKKGKINAATVEAALQNSGLSNYHIPIACFHCSKDQEPIYSCGKADTTIEGYQMNCGKQECEQHWSCGIEEESSTLHNHIDKNGVHRADDDIASESGGCYTTPRKHVHNESCYKTVRGAVRRITTLRADTERRVEDGAWVSPCIFDLEANGEWNSYVSSFNFKSYTNQSKGYNAPFVTISHGGGTTGKNYSDYTQFGHTVAWQYEPNIEVRGNYFTSAQLDAFLPNKMESFMDSLDGFQSHDSYKYYTYLKWNDTKHCYEVAYDKVGSNHSDWWFKHINEEDVKKVFNYARTFLKPIGLYISEDGTMIDTNYRRDRDHDMKDVSVLVCEKQEGDIEGYTCSCGKFDGKYYTSSGREVSPICDKIVTSIRPKESRIKTYFGEEPKSMKAIATYLDGHTEEVDVDCNYKSEHAKVDVNESYNLLYTGRIKNASYGQGTITCPITIWTAPLTGITMHQKNQVIYEGKEAETILTAHYKDMPDKLITTKDRVTTSLDSSQLGEQEVTITYKEVEAQSDAVKVNVVPKPSSVEVAEVEIDKDNIPKYPVIVRYTDGSEDHYQVSGDGGLSTVKEYSVGKTKISIPIQFKVSMQNTIEAETGVDHSTGGIYKTTIQYSEGGYNKIGVSKLKVYDTCDKNMSHAKFSHDVCPVCKYIEEHQNKLDDFKKANEALQQEIKETLEELDKNNEFTDSDFSNRYEKDVQENQIIYDKSKEKLKNLVIELEKTCDKFTTDYNSSEDIATVDQIMGNMTSELNKKREEYNKEKDAANKSYNNLVELNDRTDTMKKTIPEIIVNNQAFDKEIGKITYEYCEKEFLFDVSAKGCEFDSDVVNTKLSLYDGESFRPLKKGDLVNAGKYQIQIATVSDDYKEGTLLVELEVTPKTIEYVAKAEAKVYDGTTDCKVKYSDIQNKVGEDKVEITNPQGVFEDKNVGSDIQVFTNSEVVVTGKDSHNYVVEQPNLTGNILPKSLKVTVKPMTIEYGQPVPKNVDYIYTGFVEGESEKNVKDLENPEFKMPTVYEAKAYEVKVLGGKVNKNYNLVRENGKLTVDAPKGSKKVNLITVVSGGAIHVKANLNGKKEDMILNSKDSIITVYYEKGHVDEYTYIIDDYKYTVRVDDEGVFPILDVSQGNIVISGNKSQGVVINQGHTSYKVPYDKIIITGKTDFNSVTTEQFTGTIIVEDLEITRKDKNPINITNNSNVDIILNGESMLHTHENYAGIRVDTSSSIVISGEGSIYIPNAGIGGNSDEQSGNIKINGGEMDCHYIGDGKEYAGELHGNILINGGIINVDEIRPNATSGEEVVKAVKVKVAKTFWKSDLFYQRGENFYAGKVKQDGYMTIIVSEKEKRVEALIDGERYYIIIDGSKGSLHSYKGAASSSSSSILNNKTKEEKEKEQKKQTDILKMARSVVNDSSSIHYNKENKTYYINKKELKAKKGYSLSKDGKKWKSKISSGKQKLYADYDWYSYHKSKKELKAVILSKTIVDYEKPEVKFKKASISKKEIGKPSIEYGVSGRRTSYYKLVPKGRKSNLLPWKIMSKRTIVKVMKKGKYTLYIKATDKAGNTVMKKKTFKV